MRQPRSAQQRGPGAAGRRPAPHVAPCWDQAAAAAGAQGPATTLRRAAHHPPPSRPPTCLASPGRCCRWSCGTGRRGAPGALALSHSLRQSRRMQLWKTFTSSTAARCARPPLNRRARPRSTPDSSDRAALLLQTMPPVHFPVEAANWREYQRCASHPPGPSPLPTCLPARLPACWYRLTPRSRCHKS
jgi:hypothetical protein